MSPKLKAFKATVERELAYKEGFDRVHLLEKDDEAHVTILHQAGTSGYQASFGAILRPDKGELESFLRGIHSSWDYFIENNLSDQLLLFTQTT